LLPSLLLVVVACVLPLANALVATSANATDKETIFIIFINPPEKFGLSDSGIPDSGMPLEPDVFRLPI
jgi:hypothetical protein